MADKLKQTAADEVEHVKKLAVEGLQSRTYLYPIKGIVHFLTHRSLWSPLLQQLLPIIGLSAGVTGTMFLFTYVPQVAVMVFVSGPFAAISAAVLVLSESATITTALSKAWFIGEALVDTFDATLISAGATHLIAANRELKPGSDPMARLGRVLKNPLKKFSPQALYRYLVYLPLNFIPVVGTALFVVLQGKRMGPDLHTRYFQCKGWSEKQSGKFVEEKRAAYTSMGLIAVLLELVPIAGLFFSFTNMVGAALYAADLEKAENTAPQLRAQAEKAK